jgi:acyl carrier protein
MAEAINSLNTGSANPSTSHFDRVLHIVYSALFELNLQLPKSEHLEKSPSTVLVGTGGLDSLTLSNFIVITEQMLEQSLGCKIDLTRGDPFSPTTGHFRTVSSLATYISALMQQEPGRLIH